ncbi:MAG: hypothetical protein ACFB10_05000 [Salibacteraceae bacterium]
MLFSLGLAFVLPFEGFILAYSVLGPLHYLTEINWLRKRNFFTLSPRDFWWLLLPCTCSFICYFLYYYREAEWLAPILASVFGAQTPAAIGFFREFTAHFILAGFTGAFATVVFRGHWWRAGFTLGGLLLGWWLYGQHFYTLLTAFLPTLLHVTLFTGAFVLLGALRHNGPSGYLSMLAFAGCIVAALFLPLLPAGYSATAWAWESFQWSKFEFLNLLVGRFFDPELNLSALWKSDLGIQTQRLVTFSYTYHYLNWFSKTSFIGWHRVPRRVLFTTLGIWLLAVGLYAYDFRTGLMALLLLSNLHVIFEFPLNFRSFRDIGQLTAARLGLRSVPLKNQ